MIFVVMEKHKEKEINIMFKFHIGDKVKCTDNFFEYPCKDKIGRVVSDADNENAIGVEFEDYVNGHSFGGQGRLGHCLYLPECLLISADIKSNIPFEDKSEFTDKEILNSLSTCSRHGCIGCSLKGRDHCIAQLLTLAMKLIQRQQNEINDAKLYKEFAEKVATDVAMIEKEKQI